jgi:hypothetical protein
MDGYQCEYFCPLSTDDMCNEAESLCQYDLVHNATFANSTVMDGNPVDLYTWTDYLAGIAMAENALYAIHNVAVPYYRWQRLTPFGTYQGNITQMYGGFQAGLPTDEYASHDVDPVNEEALMLFFNFFESCYLACGCSRACDIFISILMCLSFFQFFVFLLFRVFAQPPSPNPPLFRVTVAGPR